jgi:hypothetical protein
MRIQPHVWASRDPADPASYLPGVLLDTTLTHGHPRAILDRRRVPRRLRGGRHAARAPAGLTPTLFEHINPLGTYDFSTERPAGQLRPLRTAAAAA